MIATEWSPDADGRPGLARQQRITEGPRLDAHVRELAGEHVPGRQACRQPVKPPHPSQLVGTAAADDVDDAAAGAAGFSAHAGSLEVHFSDVQLVDLRAEITECRVGDV